MVRSSRREAPSELARDGLQLLGFNLPCEFQDRWPPSSAATRGRTSQLLGLPRAPLGRTVGAQTHWGDAMSTNAAGPDAGPIFRSPWPDVEAPELPLASFVLQRAPELGNKVAIADAATGQSLTYAALADGVHRVAFGLS